MITKIELTLAQETPCIPRWDWGYRLYAAMLEQAAPRYAEQLHTDGMNPVSQFLLPKKNGTMHWQVSLLGAQAQDALLPILEKSEGFFLEHDRIDLQVTDRKEEHIEGVEMLLNRAAACPHRLDFVTPTAFKQQGYYRILPEPRLILQSQIKRWNTCFPQCPIEDEGGGLEAMANGLVISRMELSSSTYHLKGQTIPGFTGHIVLRNRLEGFHSTLAAALLDFAGYSGIGVKTTLGMGGIFHRYLTDR